MQQLLLLLLLLASTSSPPPPPFPPTTTTYWYLPSSTHNYTSKPQPHLLCNHNYEESHRVRLGGILSKWLPWHDDTWPLCLPDAEWNWDADQVSFKWPLPVTPRPTIRRLVCRHKKGMMRKWKFHIKYKSCISPDVATGEGSYGAESTERAIFFCSPTNCVYRSDFFLAPVQRIKKPGIPCILSHPKASLWLASCKLGPAIWSWAENETTNAGLSQSGWHCFIWLALGAEK